MGIKPRALDKVKDTEIKDFILACLLPADLRPSAAQLLEFPFAVNPGLARPPTGWEGTGSCCAGGPNLASQNPSSETLTDSDRTPYSPLTPHSQVCAPCPDLGSWASRNRFPRLPPKHLMASFDRLLCPQLQRSRGAISTFDQPPLDLGRTHGSFWRK